MKVLFLINNLNFGGAERLLTHLLPELQKKAVDCELLVLQSKNTDLEKSLKEEGITIRSIDAKSLYSPMNILKLHQYLLDSKYDIIHVHLFPSQYWALFAGILANRKKPLVFTEHSTSNRRISSPWWRMIDKRIYKYYTCTICITKQIQDIFTKYTGLDDSKFPVINNGLPIGEIKSAQPFQDRKEIQPTLKKSDILIMQVAAFRVHKQQETVIKSLMHLPDNYKLLLAGDGVRRTELETLVDELYLKERVFFLGNRTDIYKLQKSIDVMVMSTHYEGLSLACIEAMASGKPFIASDVKGVRELVKGYGLLFSEQNDFELANLIEKVITDNKFREETIQKCMNRVEEFSVVKMANDHIKLYKELSHKS